MAKTKKKKTAARPTKQKTKSAKKTAKKKSPAAAKKLASNKRPAAKKKATPKKKLAAKRAPAKKSAVATKKNPTTKKKTTAKKQSTAKRKTLTKLATKPATKSKPRHVNEDVENKRRASIFAEREAEQHHGREDGGQAFVNEKDGTSSDPMAEEMGRSFLTAAESGVETLEEASDEETEEEAGGPFVETSGDTEFAGGTDASNPADADREPFPTANRK